MTDPGTDAVTNVGTDVGLGVGSGVGTGLARETEEARVLGLPPVRPHATVRYGSHHDQVIDLWRPPRPAESPGSLPSRPVRLVLLHGGFWRAAYDRTHLSPLAAHLASLGYAVALPEYRRVGAGGGVPETVDDIGAALDAVRAWDAGQAPNGTGTSTEADGPIVIGHSAGGHLALWAAARPARDARRGGDVRKVVALAPVADLARAVELGTGGGAVLDLVGDLSRLPEVDPAALLPTGVATTVIHGSDDADVPVELSERFCAAARAAGDTATRLVLLPGTGHFALIEPGSAACRVLEGELPPREP